MKLKKLPNHRKPPKEMGNLKEENHIWLMNRNKSL
jgi:hypothetical protein